MNTIYKIILLLIISAVIDIKTSDAQVSTLCGPTGVEVELNSSCSSSGEYIGRDRVVFKQGYSFKEKYWNGQLMQGARAYLDNTIVGPLQQNLNNNNEVSIIDRELDFNLPVGKTNGVFSVNMIGASTYSIPISIPQGTNGFVPNLSVYYNSNIGETVMGVGWNIDAVSTIYRVSSSLEFDGQIKEPQLLSSDVFELDGVRLIKFSNYEYRTSSETFSRIVPNITTGQFPDIESFVVYTKDGLILEYGVTDDSKIKHSQLQHKSIGYNINKVTDQYGNYFTYHYYQEQGINVLQRIDYTSNDNFNIPSTNSVYFVYEKKNQIDYSIKYGVNGTKLKNHSLLLTEIRIANNDMVFHRFKFNYARNINNGPNFIRLIEVVEIGRDGQICNSTVFNWGNDGAMQPIVYSGEKFQFNEENYSLHFSTIPFFGDFLGNGSKQKAKIGRTYSYTNSSNVKYFTYHISNVNSNILTNITQLAYPENTKKFRLQGRPSIWGAGGVGDINGDGLEDVLVVQEILYHNGSDRSFSFIPVTSEINSTGHAQFSTIDFLNAREFLATNNDTVIGHLVDMNSDGLSDLVILRKDTIEIFFSTINKPFANKVDFSHILPNTSSNINLSFFDYNGDGLVDIIFSYKQDQGDYLDMLRVAIANYTTVNEYSNMQFNSMTYLCYDINSFGITNTDKLVIGDFNGDGKSDIFSLNGSKILFSKGKDGEFDVRDFDIIGSLPTDPKNIFVGDFNGDTKTDLLTFTEFYASYDNYLLLSKSNIIFNEDFYNNKKDVHVVGNISNRHVCNNCKKYNTPTGWGSYYCTCGSLNFYESNKAFYYKNTYNNTRSRILNVIIDDFNNDGADEVRVLTHNYDEYSSHVYNGDKHNYYQESFIVIPNFRKNKITAISDGLNFKTLISYKQCNFSKTVDNYSYPRKPYKPRIDVVSKYEHTNGIGGRNIVSYEFNGGVSHSLGKGFLGFSDIIQEQRIDQSHVIKKIQKIRYNNDFSYPDSYLIEEKLNNKDLSKSEISNRFHMYSAGSFNHFLPYVESTSSKNWIWNENLTSSILKTNVTNFEYDFNWGNLLQTTSSTDDIISQTIFQNYSIYGSWCPNKPSKIINNIENDVESRTIETEFNWDNLKGHLISEKTWSGMLDPNSNNPTGISTTPTITKTYEYYPTGNLKSELTTTNEQTQQTKLNYYYDSKFIFPIKVKNDLNHFSNYEYDKYYGNITSYIDENGLKTNYIYNKNGLLKNIEYPNKKKSYVDIVWATNPIESKLFKTIEKYENSAPSINYFDVLGRNVFSEEIGFNGLKITSTKYYNYLGQLVQVRANGPNNKRIVSTLEYDLLGRTVASSNFNTFSADPVNIELNNLTLISQNRISYDIVQCQDYNNLLQISSRDDLNRYNYVYMDNQGKTVRKKDDMGNTVDYKYNVLNDVKEFIVNDLYSTFVEYDKFGRQFKLSDPDAGISQFEYNALNQLVKQIDAKENTSLILYDQIGRILNIQETDINNNVIEYNYFYDNAPFGKGKLHKITGGENNMSILYKYNKFSQIESVEEVIDNETFIQKFEYDNDNRLSKYIYPNNYSITYHYDNYTQMLVNMKEISGTSVWELSNVNNLNVPTKTKSRNGVFERNYEYNDLMQLTKKSFKTTIGQNSWINANAYTYDQISGNMTSRKNMLTKTGNFNFANRTLTETFVFDNIDRLKKIEPTNSGVGLDINYKPNGAIESKYYFNKDEQNYIYDNCSFPLNAVSQVSPLMLIDEVPIQEITYTSFNKIKTIKSGEIGLSSNFNSLTYTYGPDKQRRLMIEEKFENENLVFRKTKYYSSNFEKETFFNGTTTTNREINYIFAPDGLIAIRETKNGIGKMYYTATDNLGSINMIVDGTTGQIVDDLSYDAWGRNRNPYDWTYSNITLSNITNRGYTGHEHMTNFGLINMNGRVYDPYISQFLSPDPFVQDPSNPQNYNRFSYVLNNPLKYTDPSGYNYIDPNGNFVWGMGVKPSSNNADGAGKYNDWLSYWDDQWVNRDSDWGGVEETLNSLFDMGKNPKGLIRKGNGDIYYSWASDYQTVLRDEKGYTRAIKLRTFNHALLFHTTSKKKSNERIIKESASGGGGSSNPVQTASDVNNYTGIFISAADQVIKNTKFGSNIAYAISGNSNLVYAVNNGLKFAPYAGLGVTIYTGSRLSRTINPATNQPYQSWLETGTDIGANVGIIYIGTQFGGWWGAGAAGLYLLNKAAFKHYIEECGKGTYQGIPSYRR